MQRLRLDVSDEKATWLRTELEPDEELIWSGEPKPRYFTPTSRGAFLFGIPWTAFSIFWIAGASVGMTEDVNAFTCGFPAFGLPFVLIGIGLVSTPYFQRRRLDRSAYAVTSRRVLVVEHDYRNRRSVRSFAARELKAITKTILADETADVMFAIETKGSGSDATTSEVGFHGIRDARGAEAALRTLAGA